MRHRIDLSGYWAGRLELNPEIDVAAPAVVEQDFFVPLPWNKQIEHLRWPGEKTELTNVVERLGNQNFRLVQRKFNEGVIVYRRELRLPSPPAGADERVFLVFEGSNYSTEVAVNGQPVGGHEGGHLAFEFDVSDALAAGVNVLEVKVDNRRRPDACPREQFNWMDYGGMYRPVCLEWRPAVHIVGCAVRSGRDGQGWYADITVEMSGPPRGPVTAGIVSGRERGQARLEGQGAGLRGRVRLADPVVWEVGQGGLSQVRVVYAPDKGAPDECEGHFGFRTIAAADRRILVNGRAVRILGACWHEHHAVFGNSVPSWQVDHDIQLMKHAGLNAIRAAHYPHAQGFYDACDRAGMLVTAELPCWQFDEPQFANPAVRKLATGMAGEMVRQLGNHPCIFGWVIQTESETYQPGGIEFFRAVNDAFTQADPERLTISAGDPGPAGHLDIVTEKKDPPPAPKLTDEFVDVLGIHSYHGWYGGRAQDLGETLDRNHAQRKARLFLATEVGAEGVLGLRSLEMHPWTEDYQAELLCRHIRTILDRDFMAGFFIWLFMDYECSSIGIRGINSKGLVDEYRRPKLSFNMVKALLAQRRAEGKV